MAMELVYGYDRLDEVRALFSDYTQMLVELDPVFKSYLELQRYDGELLHPGEKYALPDGRLYLALWDGVPAGCIALRRIDDSRCELKRMYVRPEYRGHGIASALVRRLIEDAGSAGYRQMLLDTLPKLSAAIRLYSSFGFYYTQRYNDSPLDYSIFMAYDLGAD